MPDADKTFSIPPLSPKPDDGTPPAQPVAPGSVAPMPGNDWSTPAAAPPPVVPQQPVAPPAPPVQPAPLPPVEPLPPQPAPVQQPQVPVPPPTPEPVAPAMPVAPQPPVPAPPPGPGIVIEPPSIPVDDGLGQPPPGAPGAAPAAPPPVPGVVAPSADPTNTLDLSAPAAPLPTGMDPTNMPPDYNAPTTVAAPPLPDGSVDTMAADAAMLGTQLPSAQPKKSPLKIVLIVAGAILGLIMVLSLVLYLTGRSSRKPAIELNDQAANQPVSEQPAATTAEAVIPDGFVKIDRDCYSFAFPKDNTVPPADKACPLTAKIGNLGLGTVTVVPSTEVVSSLDSLVTQVKNTSKVVSEEGVKLDGVDAKKLILDTGTAGAANQSTKYLAIVKDKNYQLNGKQIQSFDITITTGQDFFKKVADTLFTTWRWKTATATTTP